MGSNFGNTVLTNIGSMENKGVEFNLNFIPVQTKDWNLTVGFNGTFHTPSSPSSTTPTTPTTTSRREASPRARVTCSRSTR